jgi:hypothetical protein
MSKLRTAREGLKTKSPSRHYLHLYDLRLSAATLALAAGVSPKIVSEHASLAFTLEVLVQSRRTLKQLMTLRPRKTFMPWGW